MGARILECTGCGARMRAPENYTGAGGGHCLQCGANWVLIEGLDAPAPYAPPPRPEPQRLHIVSAFDADPDEYEEPAAAPIRVEGCARCGKPFRGDWDRHETYAGVLCDRCARRASDDPQEGTIARKKVAPPEVLPGLAPRAPSEPDEEELREEERERRQRGLVFLIVGLACTAIFVSVIPVEQFSAWFAGQAMKNAENTEPHKLTALLFAVRLLLRIAAEFVPLYAFLHLVNRFPHDDWRGNVLVVGAYAAGFAVAGAAMPMVGMVLLAGGTALFIIKLWLLMNAFNLEWRHLFGYALVSMILAPLVGAAEYGIITVFGL